MGLGAGVNADIFALVESWLRGGGDDDASSPRPEEFSSEAVAPPPSEASSGCGVWLLIGVTGSPTTSAEAALASALLLSFFSWLVRGSSCNSMASSSLNSISSSSPSSYNTEYKTTPPPPAPSSSLVVNPTTFPAKGFISPDTSNNFSTLRPTYDCGKGSGGCAFSLVDEGDGGGDGSGPKTTGASAGDAGSCPTSSLPSCPLRLRAWWSFPLTLPAATLFSKSSPYSSSSSAPALLLSPLSRALASSSRAATDPSPAGPAATGLEGQESKERRLL
mmetsp:Transcript_4667/g.8882  ORF Transcript_4667/g.8882 Transcript_4667/m.8882 type:complete len:276 (-) Transcript_4667:1157-1984(-)